MLTGAALATINRLPVLLVPDDTFADHPQCLGAIGSTGTTAANAVAAEADVVIGIGTRYFDFITASRTAFQHPGVQFVNVNVAGLDAVKHAGLSVVADAREALESLTGLLEGYRVDEAYRARCTELDAAWDVAVQSAYPASTPNAAAGGRHKGVQRPFLTPTRQSDP